MDQLKFGTITDSISILVNEVWNAPDWADWFEDSLELNIHPKLRMEISLTGLGGSVAYLKRQDGTVMVRGAPLYDMSPGLHKDLSFVAQVGLDIFFLLEGIRRDQESKGEQQLSGPILSVIGPIIMFFKVTLELRPDMIQKGWYGPVLDALQAAGVPLDID